LNVNLTPPGMIMFREEGRKRRRGRKGEGEKGRVVSSE
jgi:hypothetical protein